MKQQRNEQRIEQRTARILDAEISVAEREIIIPNGGRS